MPLYDHIMKSGFKTQKWFESAPVFVGLFYEHFLFDAAKNVSKKEKLVLLPYPFSLTIDND